MKHSILENGDLEITLEPDDDREEVAAWRGNDWPELFDSGLHLFGNGWDAVAPEWIGALTDAPIVTDGMTIKDDDTREVYGKVWWFPNYQVEDPIETLVETGRVVFRDLMNQQERDEARKARNEKVPIAWRLVKVEQASLCGEEWIRENKIKACGFFYLYDANRHVHICSFTPSYELFPIEPYVLFTEEVSDEHSDKIEDDWRNSDEPAVSYMDVSDVDRLLSQPIGWDLEPREEGEDSEAYYQRAAEEIREHYQGNPPWFDDEPPSIGFVLPRDLRPGDVIERRNPHDGSQAVNVTIREVRKARELGACVYVIIHSEAWGHTTFRIRPKNRLEVRRPVKS